MDFKLTKLNAYAIVFLIWAAIYLPGLGAFHINFNEGRRIMPAVGMLDTGNWRVPSLAGEEYFKKPPMINWLIAGSFIVFGEMSDFAARFPSAVAVLAFVTLLVLMPSGFMDIRTRFAAAIIFLTSAGCIDNGTQAEIDSVYACVTGMAMISWLNLWSAGKKSSLALWLIPGIIIGFGLLVKGPIILLFFYMVVISVLAYEKRLRELLSLHHALGIIAMVGIFMSWMLSVPASAPSDDVKSKMAGTWIAEMWLTFQGEDLNLPKWPLRASGAFLGLLPWLLFAPFLFKESHVSKIPDKDRLLFKGCRFAVIAALIIVNLMPAVKARYSLPIYGLALTLIGWMLIAGTSSSMVEKLWRRLLLAISGIAALACLLSVVTIIAGGIGSLSFIPGDVIVNVNSAISGIRSSVFLMASGFLASALSCAAFFFILKKNEMISGNFNLVLASGVVAALLGLSVASFALPVAARYQKGHDKAGAEISSMIKGGTLHAYKVTCEPFLFYIRPPVKFFMKPEQVHEKVKYLLYRSDMQAEVDGSGILSGRNPRVTSKFMNRKYNYTLVELDVR
ncbi:MAG TPA: hypothetical protein DCZ94_12995 [Lentisphaeria bacterium]|nr:MAG: hypothetical protein A2X48_06125 [Lentisphaerae bacterium GWF2_49_21]HBC87865.1 hypothetical protein [Lentisphaeria bacterium]